MQTNQLYDVDMYYLQVSKCVRLGTENSKNLFRRLQLITCLSIKQKSPPTLSLKNLPLYREGRFRPPVHQDFPISLLSVAQVHPWLQHPV